MSGPIERYDAIRSSNKFIFVVFYRGSWCPFCQAYLKELQSLSSKVEAAGGHIVTVTAEAESELPKMRTASGYTGETIVDTQNLLAKELKRRQILEVAISEKNGYPDGMAQPAVLIGGEGVGGILFKWVIVPGVMNLGGAKDRPVLSEVWDNAEAQMQGKPQVHAKLSFTSFAMGLKHKLFGW